MSQQITLRPTAAITTQDWERFESFTNAAQSTVAESSRKVYGYIYRGWAEWCEAQGRVPLDLKPVQVLAYIDSRETTVSTRHMQLSALRSLALMLATLEPTPAHQANYNALKLARIPKATARESDRQRRALQPEAVDKLLAVWAEATPLAHRNRALIALLFASGLRRAEAAALRWDDLNLADGTLTVRHGKGDKLREVSIAGEFAIIALTRWRTAQGAARRFIFCPITAKGKVGQDRPINAQAVYRAVIHTQNITGITFRPHDARRTLITDALESNVPLADVQAQAGHAQASTTLRYAQPVDAKRRRAKFKLRYGDHA